MRPVTTSIQARLVELGGQPGIVARIELTNYCLKNCVESLNVSGKNFYPLDLAQSADISDESTLAVMLKIGEMVANAAFAKGEDVKK